MKIQKIEGYVLSSPYGDGNVFGQPKGVKSIAIVEVHVDGLVGYGESYVGVYAPELFVSTVNFLKERIIGKEVLPILPLLDELHVPFISGGGFVKSIIGAIDIALYDIVSQAMDQPLYQGLPNVKIPPHLVHVYASGGSVSHTKHQIRKEAELIYDSGIHYYKLRNGYQGLVNDLERMDEALLVMGDGNVMVDYIQGTLKNMSREEIMYNLSALNEYDLHWIEELSQPYDIDTLSSIYENSKNPIAMGEHFTNELEFRNLCPYVDFVQPDVTQCGGFTGVDKIMKSLFDTDVAMHCWGSSISFNSNLHTAIAYGTMMEYPLVTLEINEHINKYVPDIIDGVVQPPKNSGLGIYISKEIKEKYKFVNGSGYRI